MTRHDRPLRRARLRRGRGLLRRAHARADPGRLRRRACPGPAHDRQRRLPRPRAPAVPRASAPSTCAGSSRISVRWRLSGELPSRRSISSSPPRTRSPRSKRSSSGIVQGLTEFLPISSTAHLRIVPALAGWEDPGAAFTAVVQLGTMAAVLLYFRARPVDHCADACAHAPGTGRSGARGRRREARLVHRCSARSRSPSWSASRSRT